MALAWLSHLTLREEVSFSGVSVMAWLMVLPEYALNIAALRMGIAHYTAGQMAAFRLSAGVVFIAITSRLLLGEELTLRKISGFVVMVVAMVLIGSARKGQPPTGDDAGDEVSP